MARSLRDIAGEAVLLAGGARAILLQIADPAVARGVAEHSDFAARPLNRLSATMTYVYAVVFGDDDDRAWVHRRVGRAHAVVRDGTGASGYSAFDPELQLWVTATLYDTTLAVWDRVFEPLDTVSADRVYRDYAEIGTALQLPADAWPVDRTAFDSYWHERMAQLEVTDTARRVARDLLHPSAAPWWLRALMPLVRLVTVGLLPDELRRAYGFDYSPARRRRFERWMRVTARWYPRLPRRVRMSARDHYLRVLRRERGVRVRPP